MLKASKHLSAASGFQAFTFLGFCHLATGSWKSPTVFRNRKRGQWVERHSPTLKGIRSHRAEGLCAPELSPCGIPLRVSLPNLPLPSLSSHWATNHWDAEVWCQLVKVKVWNIRRNDASNCYSHQLSPYQSQLHVVQNPTSSMVGKT